MCWHASKMNDLQLVLRAKKQEEEREETGNIIKQISLDMMMKPIYKCYL